MSKIAVITDSNAHITPQEAEKLGISVVPMPFMIGDETFYEGITLSREEFYAKMESGANIVTSQPSPSDVMKIWDNALKTHDEVVYIPMSSGLSGSCQSARMLADDYDGKVQVVNNQRISVTQKRSVLDALEMAEMGMSAAQIREELEHVKYESSIYIMLDTLYYLKNEGFFHLEYISGTVEEARLEYLIRDHDREKFEKKKQQICDIADRLNSKYGEGTVSLEISDTYRNMREKIYPDNMFLIGNAEKCMKDLGITPVIKPIRGGTDGANLSFRGLPCPNLCAGGHNFHGRYEYCCKESMEKIAELLAALTASELNL